MNFSKVAGLACFLIAVYSYILYPDFFRFIIFLPIIQYCVLINSTKENKPLTVLFIYAIVFNLYLVPKFIFNIDIVVYDTFYKIDLYNKALLLNIIFVSSLMFFLKPTKPQFYFPDYRSIFPPNRKIVVINLLIMTSILLFGFSGQNVLDNVEYGTESFGEKTIFTEYFIIFLSIAIFFCESKKIQYLILCVAMLMAFKSILYGSRISALLIFMTLYILIFANAFSLKKIILVTFLGLMLMNFVGMLRTGVLNTEISALLRTTPDSVMVSTQSNMFYGSVSFLGLIENGILDFDTRLKSLLGFITRLFLPTSWTMEEGSLAQFGQKFVPMGGGAHPVTYFYVWFGYGGPVLLAYFLAKTFNHFHKQLVKSKFFYFFVVMLLSTVPRWFGYEPGIIVKFWWVGSVILIFMSFFFKTKWQAIKTS